MGCDIHEYYERRRWPEDRERCAFLRTIRAAPADQGPVLVYADWVEEQRRDPGRAAALRAARGIDDVLDLELPWEEYDWRSLEKPPPGRDPWDRAGDVGRNYHLFWALAGVRGGPGEPFSAPRGLPVDVSPTVLAEWTTCVHHGEEDAADWAGLWEYGRDADDRMTRTLTRPPTEQDRQDRAASWLNHYRRLIDDGGSWRSEADPDRCRWLVPGELASYPDWHSTSWITLAEVKAHRWNRGVMAGAGSFFKRAVGMMGRLGTPDDVRFVFWFDN